MRTTTLLVLVGLATDATAGRWDDGYAADGGNFSWSGLIFALGILSLIFRRVEGSESTEKFVPNLANFSNKYFWVWAIIEFVAKFCNWLGISGFNSIPWIIPWGIVQILLFTYVIGCKHGQSGQP